MATTPVEFTCISGLTLTAEVYPFGSDTIGNTGGDSATEATNRKGLYSFSVTEALAGWHTVIIKEGTDIRAVYEVYLVDDTNIHRCHEHVDIQYEGGAVWIDTVNGSAGTTAFLNGTQLNPVNSIADALTIAAALKLSRIRVAPGSSITLAATLANFHMSGENWTLALGGQAITGSYFFGATVSGTGTTAGAAPVFEKCITGTMTLPPCIMRNCILTNTITMGSAGDFKFFDCKNGKGAGSGLQFTFIASCLVKMLNCNGFFQFANGDNSNTIEWNGGGGKARIMASCNEVVAILSGTIDLLDQGADSVISDTSRYAEDQSIYHVFGKVLGVDVDGSSIQGEGAWVSGHDGWPLPRGLGLVAGLTADSGTTTSLTDAVGLPQTLTDYWKGSTVVFTGGALLGIRREITSFNPSTDTITFSPAVPTPVTAGMTYEIWPIGAGSGSGVAGAGSIEVDILSTDEDGNPIDGVAVWITTDEPGINIIAGPVYSLGNGLSKFWLDNNSNYWAWRQLNGINFDPNPEIFTIGSP